MKNKGEMQISFGMIFSIIMIIIFITFAFYGIGKFLSIQNTAQAGKFANDLQNDIDKMWKSSQGSQEQEYFLPSKVKYVCFTNYEDKDVSRGSYANFFEETRQAFFEEENLFLYPIGSGEGFDSVALEHLDIEKITEEDNPLCFANENGKVVFTIKKNFGEALVTISE